MSPRLVLALALLAAAAPARPADLNVITAVEVRDEGGAVVLAVKGSKKPSFTTFSMADPPRFVIDFSESRFEGVPEDLQVQDGVIQVVKNLSYGSDQSSIARVMIAFAVEVAPPAVEDAGDTLVVRVAKPDGAGPAVAAKDPRAEKAAAAAEKAAAAARAEEEAAARAREEEVARAREEADRRAREEAEAQARARDEAALQARAAEETAAEARAAEQVRAEEEARARVAAQRQAAEERERLDAQARAESEREAQAAAAARDAEEARAAEAAEAERQAAARIREQEARRAAEEAAAAAEPEPVAPRPEPSPEPEAAPEKLAVGAPSARLREVGFKQLAGVSRVFVRTSVTPRFTIQDAGDDVIRVELENTRAERRNDLRFLDTSFFSSAVALVTPSRRGSSYVLDIKLRQRVPYQQKIEGDLLAIDFERPPAAAADAPAAAEAVPAADAGLEPALDPAGADAAPVPEVEARE